MSAEPLEAEERAEHLAGGIYGTIVVAGLLAATGPDESPEVFETAVWVVATVLVFWLAHSYALHMGRRAVGITGNLRQSLTRNWPLVQSCFLPLLVMFVADALGEEDENAILIAGWVCVVQLGVWGLIIGRREHTSWHRVVLTTAGCAGLGALMIVLKIIIH